MQPVSQDDPFLTLLADADACRRRCRRPAADGRETASRKKLQDRQENDGDAIVVSQLSI